MAPSLFKPLSEAELRAAIVAQTPPFIYNRLVPHEAPSSLSLRLRYLNCVEETGSSYGSDHIYIGGSAVDTFGNTWPIAPIDLGGGWDTGNDQWFETPLAIFNLDQGRGWPRTYYAIVTLANKAESKLWSLINNLVAKVKEDIAAYVGGLAGAYVGAEIGGALGSAAGLLGAALGAIVGAAVGYVIDIIWRWLENWLTGHVFKPVLIECSLGSYHSSWDGSLTSPLTTPAWWKGAGGHYRAQFDYVLSWSHVSVPTAISRGKDMIDVFRIGEDMATRTAAWGPQANWQWAGWWDIGGGLSTGDAPITPVSKGPDNLDVFVVGLDGRVWTAAWGPQTNGTWTGWSPILDATFILGTYVSAVVRGPEQLDIFITGTDGGVYSAAFGPQTNGSWAGWWRILDGVFPPGSPLSVVSCVQDQIDIFGIAPDGNVYSAVWSLWTNYEWKGWWRILEGSFAPGALVSAVSRGENMIDIFAVAQDGGVYTAAWGPQTNQQWAGWSRIADGVFTVGTPIAVVSRGVNNLDVFGVAPDGQVYTAAWGPQTNYQWSTWSALPGAVFTPGSPVAVSARNPEQLDIFVNGLDGNIWSNAWHDNWIGWFTILP